MEARAIVREDPQGLEPVPGKEPLLSFYAAPVLQRLEKDGEQHDLHDFFVAAPHDDGSPVMGHYDQTASNDPARPQVWGYTDALSYGAGDVLRLHVTSNAARVRLMIFKTGLTRAKC